MPEKYLSIISPSTIILLDEQEPVASFRIPLFPVGFDKDLSRRPPLILRSIVIGGSIDILVDGGFELPTGHRLTDMKKSRRNRASSF